MVINDERRKVIFIHIPKCGGISVENTIHKALGGDDVITRNNLIRIPERPDVKTCKGLSLHSKMIDYSRYYGDNIKDFYVFGFVRNPWRRMVSHYEYLIKQMYNENVSEKDKLNFPSFVQMFQTKVLAHTYISYDDYFKDTRNTNMNYIGKLENIKNDMLNIGNDIKLDLSVVLHSNETAPELKEHTDWRKYYNKFTIDLVYKMFKDDINKYEYTFDN